MDAQYMPQPWRGPTDVTLVTPQISNNNNSMRLNNTKKQPIAIQRPHPEAAAHHQLAPPT
jgi:hypothetical protein